MTERLNINNLLPDTDYVVQVRAVNDAGHSKWSQKFNFKTIDDTVNGTRKPKTPTNVTWTFDDTGFHATWDEVTKNTDNSTAQVRYYNVELVSNGATKVFTVQQMEGTVRYDLTLERAKALFGGSGNPIGTIQLRVQAVNSGGTKSDWTAPLSAVPAAPEAPINGTIEEMMEALKISWDAPSSTTNLTGYHIYVGTSADFTAAPSNRVYEGKETEFTYATSTFVQHWFKIRSYSEWGQESADLVVTGTPKNPYLVDTTPPAVPTSLAAAVVRNGAAAKADLTWTFNEATAGNEDIMQFAIRWRRVGTTNWFLDFADKASRAMSLDLPQPYANYEFQIASLDNVANYSAWSTVVTLNAGIAGAPPQTVGVTATPGLGSVQLQWTPSTHADVTYGGYYEVQLATNSGFTTGLLTYQTGNTSISVNGLPQSTVYYYRVRAIDVDGNQGAYSATANVTTDGVIIPEPTDGNAPASSPTPTVTPGLGYLFVSWTPVANADLVKYEVHISTTSDFTPGPGTKVAETPGTIVTLENTAGGTALDYGTTYYVKLIAKDDDGAAAAGAQASGSPNKVSSGDIVTIIADQIGTGSLSAATVTISSTGVIQSANYVANTSGFKLSSSVVDIQSGIVNFGTLAAGTMTATGLSIGAGGLITVDATGAIQSNNYASNSTGWRLSSTGLELNGGSVKASALIGGTFTGGNFVVGSGGSITGTGFTISSTGITITNGGIYGPTVQTNSLYSYATDPVTGNYLFSINAGGYAQLAGARILGNTVLGSSSNSVHYIQSYNYVYGSQGWKIDASGVAEFSQGTFRGALRGASYSTSSTGTGSRVDIETSGGSGSGSISFYHNTGQAGAFYYNGSGMTWYSQNAITIVAPTISMAGSLTVGQVFFYGQPTSTRLDYSGLYGIPLLSGISSITGGPTISGGPRLTGGASVTGSFNINNGIVFGDGMTGSGGGNIDMNAGSIYNVMTIGGWGGSGVTLSNGPTLNGGPILNGTVRVNSLGGSGNSAVRVTNAGGLTLSTSSIKFKENVKDLDLDMDAAFGLRAVEFHRKEERGNKNRRVYTGFIAEEAHEAGLTKWVTYYPDGDILGIDYEGVTSMHHKMLQELREENRDLKASLTELRELVQQLVNG